MAELFTLSNFFTLLMLVLLQAVLGFDNLLYVSLESRRVAPERQAWVRRWGIGLAIALRMILLFVVIRAIEAFEAPFFEVHWAGIVGGIQPAGGGDSAGRCIHPLHGHQRDLSHAELRNT